MDNELQASYTTEQTYHSIRHSIVSAQRSLSAPILLRISNSRHTVSRIELVALSYSDAGSQ